MAVITVSRGLGSGGDEIARHVADRLDVPFLDREITRAVAEQAGVSEENIRDTERSPGLVERMLRTLARYPVEESYHWPTDPGIQTLDTVSDYRRLIAEFIRSIADRGKAVIVGHGASAILADHPNAIRVLFYAPIENRIARVMALDNVDARAAERRIRETDAVWRDFLKTYHNVDWTQSRHFDLVINTGRFSYDTAVELVVSAALAVDHLSD